MSKTSLLSSRTVISIAGPDARSFLQGLVTQDMTASIVEVVKFGALLTPQGKIFADFIIAPSENGFLLDCSTSIADALLKKLVLYRLRAKVVFEKLNSWVVAAQWGEPEIDWHPTGALYFVDPRTVFRGHEVAEPNAPCLCRIIGPRDSVLNTVTSGWVDETEYDNIRIANAIPEFGKDFSSDEMFLMDVNYDALAAVSYKKGCFIGQEVSSRMKRKGEPRRRTVVAAFDGPAPAKGASITAGDSTLGEVMSGVPGLALASIRLDRWEKAKADGAPVNCEGRPLHLRVPAALERG